MTDGRCTIAVIEDNRTDVFLLQEAIAAYQLDVDVKVMEDGEQAISFISGIDADERAVSPKLFLLDLNLPRASGLKVLERLRGSKRCAETPVVIMTSSDAQRDRADTAALGATDYFRKPSGYEAFLRIGEIIRKFLKEPQSKQASTNQPLAS